MPGAGKSTVGVLLAKAMGHDFLDTDILIQRAEGADLAAIIRKAGVAGFRDIEENHILGLDRSDTVIATGGSVVYGERAMRHLRSAGIVVFLDISLPALESRLDDIDGRGVLRAPGQTLADIYAERAPLYRRWADIRIDCDGLGPDRITRSIVAAWMAHRSRRAAPPSLIVDIVEK